MKIFAIFKKDLLIFFRNRADVAVQFLMPLAFIIPISLALGSGDGYGINRNNTMILLPVVNYDQGPRAQVLMTGISESLKLEYGFDAQRVQAVGLQNDPQCQQAAAAAQWVNATATAAGKITPAPSLTPSPTMALPTATSTPSGIILRTNTPAVILPTATATLLATPLPAGGPTSLPQSVAQASLIAGGRQIARCDEAVARAMLQRTWRTAVLIIPENFSQTVDAGKPAQVTLLYDPGGDAIRMQQIEGVVKGATVKLSLQNQIDSGLGQLNELAVFAPDRLRNAVEQQSGEAPTPSPNPALRLQKVFPDNSQVRQTPDTYQQTIPGYAVMYVFFITTSMGSSLRRERDHGTLRRLLSTPVSRADFLGGKMLATVAIGLLQVFVLFAVGAVFFKLDLGGDPLAFLLLSVALVCAAAAIGLAAATTRLRGAVLTAPLIISALLGGCIFPLDLMPPLMRTLSMFVPHSWALTGFQDLMVRGQGLQDILPQIVVLLAFAAVFFAIAAHRFSFENQEGE